MVGNKELRGRYIKGKNEIKNDNKNNNNMIMHP
jgi:hypothetical protein